VSAPLVACDQGHQDDQPVAGPSIHIVGSNIMGGAAIRQDSRIELAFDRLLLPYSIHRQSFFLSDERGDFFTPEIAYDPVARVVTITPNGALENQQFYRVHIAAPQSPSDQNGLRSIDGATLDPSVASTITFLVDQNAPAQTAPPTVDFCKDIVRIFDKCAGANCHVARVAAAAGLLLDSPADIASTAVGRVAQGSNSGPRSRAEPAGLAFGVDMPILDPGPGSPPTGDPANSWMLYKMLMAVPMPPPSTTVQPPLCDGGLPAPPAMGSAMHSIPWQPLSDDERARLSNLIPGREMPFPADPTAPLSQPQSSLTLDELELVSRWIAQPRATGAPLVPASCGACIP
jgi:hypothetical protein